MFSLDMEGGSGRLGMGGEDEVGQTNGSQEQMSQRGATHGRQEDRYDSEERLMEDKKTDVTAKSDSWKTRRQI